MCLLVLAWQTHPRFELIVAANRDEFHERPTAPLAAWDAPAGFLAGRDLQAGGTWLGVSTRPSGNFAFGAITNFREPATKGSASPSRGILIPGFAAGNRSPQDYLATIEPHAREYAGFNLLLARNGQLWYGSNRTDPFARPLPAGVYGLSNHTLDTPWLKLERIRAGFAALVAHGDAEPDPLKLLALLDQCEPLPPHASLDEVMAAPFVVHPIYGTRSSTVVLIRYDGELSITERRFNSGGFVSGETRLGTPGA